MTEEQYLAIIGFPLEESPDLLCACGCGKNTKRAPYTRKETGWIKGHPIRFLLGHSGKWKSMPLADRFWVRVLKHPDDGCWEWIGSRDTLGYGVLRIKKKNVRAHRLSLELSGVSIPQGMLVCHKCDQPKCVKPDHLVIGTQKDNMADAARKMRLPHSEGHSGTTLLSNDVVAIRTSYASGESSVSIAARYKISKQEVWRIAHGDRWVNAGGPRTDVAHRKRQKCRRGHSFGPSNCDVWNGQRRCSTCRREQMQLRRKAKKAASC